MILIFIWQLIVISSAQWKQFPITKSPPQKRYLSTGAASDKLGYFIISMGRGVGTTIYEDTFKFDMKKRQWNQLPLLSQDQPQPRFSACTEFIEREQVLILFGGFSAYGPLNDL